MATCTNMRQQPKQLSLLVLPLLLITRSGGHFFKDCTDPESSPVIGGKKEMLKLNYTESGLHLERVSVSVEALLAQRLILAVRTGQSMYVEPGKAAFLLPADVPGLAQLELALQLEVSQVITVSPVDVEFVEVSLEGTWIAETDVAHEGTFITALTDRSEFFVYKLWQAQSQVSSLA